MIRFDVERLQTRIESRFEGVASRVTEWWPLDDAPNRSTVSRWLTGANFPRTEGAILALAATLDLDPLALWQFNERDFERACATIARASRTNRWSELVPALSLLKHFVDPVWDWPPAVENYYGREWCSSTLSHDAIVRKNFYARISILGSEHVNADGDQSWHFAWRGSGAMKRWHPYGLIRLRRNRLSLFSFTGRIEHSVFSSNPSELFVETWFGEGSAEFRIVSVHSFESKFADESSMGVSVRFL